MTYLQKHLSELLQEHDCVILPELGGFVCNQVGAKRSATSHRIAPPSKEVSFNARLFHNDGLFAQHLRMQEGLSYEKAMTRIKSEVAWLERQLDSGKRVEFPEVGVLYRNGEKQMVFLPSGERNFLRDAFGLESIELQAVQTGIEHEEARPIVPITAAGQSRKWLRNLAGAAAVPLLIAAAWFVQEGSKVSENFSFLPGSGAQTSDYAPRYEEEGLRFEAPDTVDFIERQRSLHPEMDVLTYSLIEDAVSPDGVRIRLKEEVVAATPHPAVQAVSPKSSALGLYFIVGGAFKEATNAEAYVQQLQSKGYDASIFGRKGDLHLVAFGSYAEKSAAMADLGRIRANDNPSAWLKRQ